jgi:carbonic anhydrase
VSNKTKLHQEVIHANTAYKENFTKADLPIFPGRHFAILTCMDARLDPAKFAGLNEGDAHVIRNAGGRASDDAIRSLVISHKLLGTTEWFVVQHTNCGMELFNDQIMGNLLADGLHTAEFDGTLWKNPAPTSENIKPGSNEGQYIKWLTFKGLNDNVKEDVSRIKAHSLVSSAIQVYGYIYDVSTGSLIEVV